ncbi:hypothetical protein MTR67_048700 [Solanum verrucosum]|uniref:Uncharacterized protein n=1 Tax=Solanum verrucosum TaxID=315347 RepID=A0AAF0UYX1_SOLVR|nr:hypothetical protein MTR67_048700 [Solanum verrucosum]
MDKVRVIQEGLRTAQSRQKSYPDWRLWALEFMYVSDKSHMLQWNMVQLYESLAFEKEHVAILDRQVWKLRSKKIPSVKVQWRHHQPLPPALAHFGRAIPPASKVLQRKLVTQQEAAATEPLASPVRPLVWCLAAPAVIILGSEFSMKPF